MLRSILSRPRLLRRFTTCPANWNVTRPPVSNEPSKDVERLSQEPSSVQDVLDNVVRTSSTPKEATSHNKGREVLSSYDLAIVKQRIRGWTEQAALTVRNRADDFTAHTKTTFSQLGSHLNRVTGYEEIEVLKKEIVEQEARINATRQAARQAKKAYEQAVIQRSSSQREVNDLLQRKSTWTDSDVGRFTNIVRQDHLYEQEEVRAKAVVDEMEDVVDREFSQLLRSILARYHEEQVWSDKIRSASTYGSLAALALNLVVFISAIVVVEPWKRRRLAQTFERKIEELSQDNAVRLDASMTDIGRLLREQEQMLMQFIQGVSENATSSPQLEQSTTEQMEPINAVVQSMPSENTERRTWELAIVGTGAFIVGVLGSIIVGR